MALISRLKFFRRRAKPLDNNVRPENAIAVRRLEVMTAPTLGSARPTSQPGADPPGTMRVSDGVSRRSIESPAMAVTPTMLDQMWGYGPTRSGVQINEQTALTFTAVYAAIKVISETLAMLPLKIMTGHQDEPGRQPATNHSLYSLLRFAPNPEMTAPVYKETLQAHALGWGNCYSRIIFNMGGQPTALLPLLPDRTHPERHMGKLKYYDSSGGRSFWPEEVLHIKAFGFNGLKGYSPIAMAREALAAGKATEMFGATFWGNAARPAGILETDLPQRPEILTNLREQFEMMHAGIQNSNRTAVLPKGVKYKQISIAPDDAQFIATRQFNILDVARIYRLPPHMLGSQERATHSNIEHAGLEFLIYTMAVWLTKWEEEYNTKLLPERNFHCRFDFRELLRADTATKLLYYASGRQWGYKGVNDIRNEEGDPQVEGGGDESIMVPVNMQPLKGFADRPVSRNTSGQNSSGQKPPVAAPQDENEKHTASIMHGIFRDAIGRMLRKESNAVGRMSHDGQQVPDSAKLETFYGEHRQHVMQSLSGPAKAMAQLTYRGQNGGLSKIVGEVADKRFGFLPEQEIHQKADAMAAEVIGRILATEVQTN